MVDIVARCIADDGQYVLSFKRNEVIFGGGRLKFKAAEIPLDYQAFCDHYKEANANLDVVEVKEVVSNTEKVPCEDTGKVENDPSEEKNEEIPSDLTSSTEDNTENVDNESAPVRRRRRRTETE